MCGGFEVANIALNCQAKSFSLIFYASNQQALNAKANRRWKRALAAGESISTNKIERAEEIARRSNRVSSIRSVGRRERGDRRDRLNGQDRQQQTALGGVRAQQSGPRKERSLMTAQKPIHHVPALGHVDEFSPADAFGIPAVNQA